MIQQIPAPDLTSVTDAVKRDTKITLNAVQIGIIQSFNSEKQTASIRIAISQVKEVLPDGTRILVEYPVLLECPVFTMFGGDSFINLPIAVGDNCIVLFNDREIDNWLNTGEVQPGTTSRTHDVSDAIAIVGIRHYQNSITRFLADGIRISFAANSEIDLTDDAIDSIANLFRHTGNMQITKDLEVLEDFYIRGDTYGDVGGNWNLRANLMQEPGRSIHAGNGATGTFDTVTVVDGIMINGS